MDRRSFSIASVGLPGLIGPATAKGQPAGARLLRGSITQVEGVKVKHFNNPRRPTGCTIIMTEEGAVAVIDVRGSAPDTRRTKLLDPTNLVEPVRAILLSGGSVLGLEAEIGVVRFSKKKVAAFPPARRLGRPYRRRSFLISAWVTVASGRMPRLASARPSLSNSRRGSFWAGGCSVRI